TEIMVTVDVFTSDEARWDAVARRDAAADGLFYYSVRSTGVYCRPSCPARRPLRSNVGFHPTPADAEQSGFRPCRRCRPDQPPRSAEGIQRACRLIERSETLPSLRELSAEAGLSRFHFHRVFTKATGLTPRAYAAALRAERVRQALRNGSTVTEAIYRAG